MVSSFFVIDNGSVFRDVRLAGATCTLNAATVRGRDNVPGPSPPLLRALVVLSIYSLLRFIEQAAQSYVVLKNELRGHLASLLRRVSNDRRYVSHMTINGDGVADSDRIFHTMRQHFRKLQQQGVNISWCKFVSFSETGGYHLHVALFHDRPLSELFTRPHKTTGKNLFDLPRFKVAASCLRPVWQHGRLACFRSYNYKIQITPHSNPSLLLTDYFLRLNNFQPDKVRAHGRQWFTASRDIVTAQTIQTVFNRISALCDALGSAMRCLGMEVLTGLAVRTLVLGKTERLERLAAVELVAAAATRGSSSNDIDQDKEGIKDSRCFYSSLSLRRCKQNVSVDWLTACSLFYISSRYFHCRHCQLGRPNPSKSWTPLASSVGRLDPYHVTTCYL